MGVQIQGDTGNVIATKGTYSGDVSIGGTLTYEDVTNIDSVGIITARSNILVGSGITLSPDGDVFTTGISTFSDDVNIGTDGKLIISGNSAVKDIEYGDGTNTGYFRSITNVNRSSAGAVIHTQQFKWNDTKVAVIKALTGDDTTNKDNAHIVFDTASAGTTGERLRILSTGGITFNGDTAAAKALYDYEEGDWTPSLSLGSPTYITQKGKYTKIGELVLCSFVLDYSNGADSSQRLAGLPFAPDTTREEINQVSRLGSAFQDDASQGSRVMHSISFTSQGTTRAYVDLIINVAARGIRGTLMYRAA